ncbi:MAG: hypothetical protein WC407_13880 [Sulfuricurvum sp.]
MRLRGVVPGRPVPEGHGAYRQQIGGECVMSDENRYMMANGNIWWYSECTPTEFLDEIISKVDSQIQKIKSLEEIIMQQVAYMKSKGISVDDMLDGIAEIENTSRASGAANSRKD